MFLSQAKCRELIAEAKAEWQDACEDGGGRLLCPVLTGLRKARPKHSDSSL